jgi:hypothetical protein
MKIVMGGIAGIKGKENMNGKAVYDRLQQDFDIF